MTAEIKEDPRFRATLSAKEAAAYVGCSYWKLLEEVKAGNIPCIRLGNRILFRCQTLDFWLGEQEKASMAKPELPTVTGGIRRLK